ncbi:hypothetical protein COO60DRAFT_856964 [Scenedesmus sp. NREL 46B-D3]|nr:hypothetical protein COO60DRAFT_856964 [Scenedesmus sp. NREL 46B-D3]
MSQTLACRPISELCLLSLSLIVLHGVAARCLLCTSYPAFSFFYFKLAVLLDKHGLAPLAHRRYIYNAPTSFQRRSSLLRCSPTAASLAFGVAWHPQREFRCQVRHKHPGGCAAAATQPAGHTAAHAGSQ